MLARRWPGGNTFSLASFQECRLHSRGMHCPCTCLLTWGLFPKTRKPWQAHWKPVPPSFSCPLRACRPVMPAKNKWLLHKCLLHISGIPPLESPQERGQQREPERTVVPRGHWQRVNLSRFSLPDRPGRRSCFAAL